MGKKYAVSSGTKQAGAYLTGEEDRLSNRQRVPSIIMCIPSAARNSFLGNIA